MRTYREYCPIAKGAEIIGDRWNLLILREMLAGVSHFNEMQRFLPGISRSVLVQRLVQLERSGVLKRETDRDHRAIGYHLTAAGLELAEVVRSVGVWAARWAFPDPGEHELDPLLIMVWLVRHLKPEALPQRRIVIRFELGQKRADHFWLVLEPGSPSLCLKHPGFDEDVAVSADTASLYAVYFGRLSMAEAIHGGAIKVNAMPRDRAAFPSWFGLSQFASAIRPAPSRPAPPP